MTKMSEQKKFNEFENMDEEKQKEFLSKAMDKKAQKDFYERLRSKVKKHIEEHPNSKYINYLVAAPDFFHLLCKLLGDSRVPIKNKLYIAGAILYFTSPVDIITDMIPGIGLADDVIIAVNVINSLLDSVDKEVINEHWVGEDDIFDQLKQLLDIADSVVGKNVFGKIKALFAK